MQMIIESTEFVTTPMPITALREEENVPQRIMNGAVAGAAGAGLLAGIMYGMWKANQGPKPMFVATQQQQFGENGVVDHVAGLSRFLIAGGVWGALFSAVTRKPDVKKGMMFGVLPSLFLWTVLAKAQGQKLFFGGEPKKILMPILFNSLIWGSFIGKAAQKPNRVPTI